MASFAAQEQLVGERRRIRSFRSGGLDRKTRIRRAADPELQPAPKQAAAKSVYPQRRLRREDPNSDPPDNFLAQYFREMAPLPVLQPEQEFEAAHQIESLEVQLWVHLLGHPQTIDVVLGVVQHGLENSLKEFSVLCRAARAARASGTSASRERYLAHAGKAASAIHRLDVDRRLLFATISELRSISRGGRSRHAHSVIRASKALTEHFSHARRLFAAAQRARNEFVKSNLRLVVSIARRFNHGRMPLSDLIQEGNIGLIKAVERYDYRRGYRFSTYASWWIRHSISRAIADKGRAVRLPVHMLDAYHKVTRASRELATKLGRAPTAEEIGSSSGLPSDKVQKIQGYLLDQSLSLDRAVSDEDDRRFIELLQDPDAAVPTEKLMDRSVNEQVQEILCDLKPIEADVLRKRFGLADGTELTLKEIGDSYRLSRERIRQIQEQALSKIRRALQRRNVI